MAATPCYGAPPAGANLEMFCCNEDETPDLLHTTPPTHTPCPSPTEYYIIGVLSCHNSVCFSTQREERTFYLFPPSESLHLTLCTNIQIYNNILFLCARNLTSNAFSC